jgi:hypothetical protein
MLQSKDQLKKGEEPMPLARDRLLKPLKKLRKLIRRMDRQPAPGKVHDLRTNTRRFESIFQALSLEEHGVCKSTLKDLGRLRKRAGKVRDLDVLTGFASTIHLKGEEECGVQLLENLGAQRKKHASRLYKEAIRLRSSLHKDLKHASSIVAKLLQEKASVSKADTRTADTMAAAAKLSAGLATPRQLGRKTLHPYRLKIKRLRNVLQMADGAVHSKFVDHLGVSGSLNPNVYRVKEDREVLVGPVVGNPKMSGVPGSGLLRSCCSCGNHLEPGKGMNPGAFRLCIMNAFSAGAQVDGLEFRD